MYVSGVTLIQPGEFRGPYEEIYTDFVGAGGAAEIVCNLPVAELDIAGYGTIVLPPGYSFPGGAKTYSWNYHGPVDNLTDQDCTPS